MKKGVSFLISMAAMAFLFLSVQVAAQSVTITQWNFNNETLNPSTGSGTAGNVGGTSTGWATGVTGSPDRAWNTSQYPAQGTNNGTAGVQFTVSTNSYQNITVSWDHRHSNTSANRIRLQYTLNGTVWLNFNASATNAVNTRVGNDAGFDNGRYIADAGDAWYVRSANLGSITGANNNSSFAVRIVSEFVDGTNYGASNPPSTYGPTGTWRFDNVTFNGEEITGATPVKLAVISVNNGVSPSTHTPFSVVVQAQDANNLPANVTQNTTIQLSRATGSGTLGGTLTATINAGSHTVTLNAVTYNIAEAGVSITATRTSGMTLSPGTSTPFIVLPKATHLAFNNVPGFGQVGTPLATFTVEARRPDNTVDVNYIGQVTISKATGPGTVAGTLQKPLEAGIATFNDIVMDISGNYSLLAVTADISDAISPVIVIIGAPELQSLILPRFIQGLNVTNNTRVPFAYRVTFNNLIPNATYKYINQVVTSADLPTANGAGNVIFVTGTGDFIRTTATGFVTPGQYGEFITSATGSFTGWFVTEPTGNARFEPGNHIFMRIRLNDGAGGTVAQHFLTTADSVRVINFGTENNALQGSGVYGRHFSTAKNFAFLYDNVAGTGRPLTGTFIENDGTSGGTTYPAFYQNNVEAINGAWGAIIPNQLPNGLRRVEIRDRASGSIIDGTTTVANGVWPYGSATSNPNWGVEGKLITPWPNFTASQTNIAPGTTVQFTDLTLGAPTAWLWQFIGGSPGTSTQQNPSIAYFNSGEFDVSMTVTTEFGTVTITKTEYINVNPLPWPEFTGTPTIVPVGSGVTFTDQSTGSPTSWAWTFESGTPASFSGQTPPAIVYNTPGQFDVTLVVTNAWGSNTLTKTDYIVAGYPPAVDFSANHTNIVEGQTVLFTDLTQHAPTSWAWVFEGGTPGTSTSQNPSIVYNTPGTFSVTLTATNQFGQGSVTKTGYIVVNPVGIKDPDKQQLAIWPNPGSGIFNVILPMENMKIKIFDLTGSMVMHSHTSNIQTTLNLSTLNKGMYIIECMANDGSVVIRTRVVIQ